MYYTASSLSFVFKFSEGSTRVWSFSLSPVSKRERARSLVMYMYNDEFPS